MYWDEDNRLMVLSDNGKTSRYTYNAAGERIMKSYGTMEGVYINGAPQGITFHETDNFTLYPASIISINKSVACAAITMAQSKAAITQLL